MSRRAIVWLVTLPLAVVGSQLAHAAAYRLATPDDHERAHELAATGHGYLAYAPTALAVLALLVVVALAHEVTYLRKATGRRLRLSARTFALVAPALFVVQEHLERLLHDGTVPWNAGLELTFLAGLLLQLPFALAAYGAARLLLRAARAAVRLLERRRAVARRLRLRWGRDRLEVLQGRPFGFTLGPRGPPSLRVV